jgi:ATP-binding cassette subfamily F protein 3
MARREVPIPSHITVLMVEQEVLGDETLAIESVLKADVWREKLLQEEKDLNALLTSVEGVANSTDDTADSRSAKRKREDATTRLGEVQQLLVEMEADTAQSRAASLLAGLGFSPEDQQRATKTFSGGWRMRLSLARALFCKPDLLVSRYQSLWRVLADASCDRCWMNLPTIWVGCPISRLYDGY